MRFRVARAAGADRRKAEGKTRLFIGKHGKEVGRDGNEAYWKYVEEPAGPGDAARRR